MPAVTLVVLASTKMQNRICVAGIDKAGKWIRPVSGADFNFTPQMLQENGRVVVEPYNVVEFAVTKALSNTPQSEDVEVNLNRGPHLVETLSDSSVLRFLRMHDESKVFSGSTVDFGPFLITNNRSLILSKVDKVVDAYRELRGQRRQRRIAFVVRGKSFDYPCTDLRWRAYTRSTQTMSVEEAVSESRRAQQTGREFLDRDAKGLELLNAASELYFTIGLTREYLGRYWPMIIGIHAMPRFGCSVDYDNL
jgi:hypothetical protein